MTDLPGFGDNSMAIEALIFDVDGTLADTERDGHRVAFNQAFVEAGLDWRWDVALYGELLAVTGGKERMRHYVDRHRPDYPKPADFEALVARLHVAKVRHYTSLIEPGHCHDHYAGQCYRAAAPRHFTRGGFMV